jgi:Tfp pilus assembly protein PilN
VITPNLATRPFLNTRPVWLLTAIAGVLALILIGFNLRLFLIENRTLGDEISRQDDLELLYRTVAAEVSADVDDLQKVPWASLRARVDATNLVLREHSFSWLRMLDDIERVMPYELRLTRIGPTVGPEAVMLSLSVIARNRDAMLQLLDNFIADPRFDEPTPLREITPEDSAVANYEMLLRVSYHPLGETP